MNESLGTTITGDQCSYITQTQHTRIQHMVGVTKCRHRRNQNEFAFGQMVWNAIVCPVQNITLLATGCEMYRPRQKPYFSTETARASNTISGLMESHLHTLTANTTPQTWNNIIRLPGYQVTRLQVTRWPGYQSSDKQNRR